MKKIVIVIICIVLVAASFAGGFAVGKLGVSENDSGNAGTANPGNTSKTEQEKTPVNVFYSPHTGNDESGDGSMEKPFETEEKARAHASTLAVGADQEIVILEFMMTVNVYTQEAAGVSSDMGTINMIPFTGNVDSYYFTGEVVGTGCDTQKFGMEGYPAFSARYLLKGTDYRGKDCSIFIENTGDSLDLCTPKIITDSLGLSSWQTANLRAIVIPGWPLTVNVFTIHD